MGTIKELGSRLDKLQNDFQKQLSEFKTLYADNIKNTTEAVCNDDFLKKFGDFEATVRENILNIKSDIDALSRSQETIIKKVEYNEYLSYKHDIIIHGIPEEENDYAGLLNKILEILNNKFKAKLTKNDLDFTTRIGKKGDKIRPVLVGFLQRWKRDNIYSMKKTLKGSGLFMCEWLPKSVLDLLKKARNLFGNNSWVNHNGSVFVKNDGVIKMIKCQKDLD